MTPDFTDELVDRHLIAASVIPTGNTWLDDAFAGGINKRQLILVAAKTGVGKTFFGVQLARFAAVAGRRVTYFALEAERHEIHRRMIYYELTSLLAKNFPQLKTPRYREWLHAGYSPEWNALETEVRSRMAIELQTLSVRYQTQVYTAEQFRKDVDHEVETATDAERPELIIIDHLHHFFLSSGDENQELKSIIHSIKRLHDRHQVPIVLLAQLRKNDGGATNKRSLPMLEDIRGTAALTDVATDALIISGFPKDRIGELPSNFHNPMFFHLAKSRTAAEARQFAAVVSFNAREGRYAEEYLLCKTKLFEDPEPALAGDVPAFAKHARKPKLAESYIGKKNFGDAR